MARWKLMTSHHLNVPGNEWEYTENVNGDMKRYRFAVPKLLDIRDPKCWTNKFGNKDNEEGEIVVCYAGKGDPRDVVFEGEPTPDMQPVDEEAAVISASFAKKWEMKPDFNPGEFSQSIIDKFQVDLDQARSKSAEIKGMDELIGAMTNLMKQNAEIMAAMAAASQPARRV